MKILIMGLPASGKTTLAGKLKEALGDVVWLNADEIRTQYNDWDFSREGRIRQSSRMRSISLTVTAKYTIADFVAPLVEQRDIFNPNFIIWMNTIKAGRFEDTNKIFETPTNADLEITNFNYNIIDVVNLISNR